jgi:hypothetical protein
MLHWNRAVACSCRNVDSNMESHSWRRGITPLRAQELYLKHADSREFEHVEDIVLSLRSVM